MLDDIVLFVHIVQHQGLAAAAQALDMPAATITRRLQRLENSLRCRLIYRSARRFGLTQEGEVYFQAYSHLVEQFEQTRQSLSEEVHDMRGMLKVMAPVNLSAGFLQPAWSAFIRDYPDIQLELSLSNQLGDLLSEKADLALRVGPQPDSLLYQKKLGTIKTLLVASPEYLKKHGTPEAMADLSQHRLIGAKAIARWSLKHIKTDEQKEVHPTFSTLVNDVNLAAAFVRDGLGISLLPETEVQHYLKEKKLCQIMPEWHGPNRDVFAVWPSGRLMNVKAKCLLEHISHFIQRN